jgi:hypothetical protein
MPATQNSIGAVITVFSSLLEKRLYKKTSKVKTEIRIIEQFFKQSLIKGEIGQSYKFYLKIEL